MSQPSGSTSNSPIEVLTPPNHFGIVEPGVYRSTMPAAANFPFLKQLGLRHVIILSAATVARGVYSFFEENGILVSHTGAQSGQKDTWKPTWKPLSEEVIKTSLELLLRAETQPLLICDTSGVERVGVVVGCLRRLQNWNLNSVINEYRSFAGRKTRYTHKQMIEMFDTDLVVIPANPASWCSEQLAMDSEDEDKFEKYRNSGRISSSGTLIDAAHENDVAEAPAYSVYYYTAESPLNSVIGANPPVIQNLSGNSLGT
jgi:protein tyrosine/serine phosphatase